MTAFTVGFTLAVPSWSEDSAWVSIIPKGSELTGWVPKFEGKAVGVNPDTTFRMSPEGYIWVNQHTSYSRTGFGHLYYTKEKFSYYMVRAEYKFTKETSESGFAAWTNQNNGLMIHSPDPSAVTGQFPNSIEVQLLGPKNTNEDRVPSATWPVGRTGAMCIAGDAFVVTVNGNSNYTNHCTSPTYPDAWKGTRTPWEEEYSQMTVRVLADSLVQHYIKGQKVFETAKIRLKSNNTPVKEGYLSIQAEGTAALFRKIDILSLIGCMDKQSAAYRSYFVKNDPAACQPVAIKRPSREVSEHALERMGSDFVWRLSGIRNIELFRMDGSLVGRASRNGEGAWRMSVKEPGVYRARVETEAGVSFQSVSLLP